MNTLIEECSGIIYSLASKYKNNYNIEDLYQVGCIGVIKAYNNFDKELNVKFTTYAYKYIVGEMIEYIRKDRNIKVSSEYYDIYKRYKKVKELLQNRYLREVRISEVADFMKINEKDLVSVIEKVAFTTTISETNDYSKDDNLINKLILDEEIDKLKEPDKSIIRYRYYFGLSQDETARTLNLSQSKVSRYESNAIKTMKLNII